tara:strand:- start:9143 stop:10906 length:1764 start_codon:yes stop_codon:yes gene_type:complete
MAKNVNIKLGANISDFESKMKRAQKGFKRTAANLKRIGKSMSMSLTAPLTAFAAASLNAFDQQAKAEAQLRTALGDNKDAFERLTTAAQEFQEISLFGDEEIIAQQAYLASLGLTETKIKDVIRASMDLAAGTGQTLEFGVKNLAKTFSGLTGELGESIPALKNLTAEQLKAGEAVDVVAQAFKGQAKAASEAGLGGVQQLKNSVGDLAEELGKALMPMVNELTDRVKVLVDGFKTLTAAQMEMKVKIAAWTAAIGPLLVGLSAIIKSVTYLGGQLKSLARSIIVPVVIVAIDLLISTLAVAIAAFGGWVVAGVALLAAAFTSLAHTFLTANDELVKFNAAQAESVVLTKQQAAAIDGIMVPFVASISVATNKTKELKIALEEVAQISSVDNDDGVGGKLIRVKHELDETEESISNLGNTAMNTFSSMADGFLNLFGRQTEFVEVMVDGVSTMEEKVLSFGEKFGNFAKQIIKDIVRIIAKAVIMAGVLSLLSGGTGGVGILGVGEGLSFGEAFKHGILGRASGGSVVAGQPYVVGERGPEMFMPGQSGTIIPNNNLGGGGIPDVKISGEDLIIVFDRAKRHRNALG